MQIDVLDKPVDLDRIESTVVSALKSIRELHSRVHLRTPFELSHPRSAAERWARCIVRACGSDADIRTLEEFARAAAVSVRVFTEVCGMVNIRPLDARDLARILRALMHGAGTRPRIEAFLNVSDRRTLNHILDRTGFTSATAGGPISVVQFLDAQWLVPLDNEGLAALRSIIGQAEPA